MRNNCIANFSELHNTTICNDLLNSDFDWLLNFKGTKNFPGFFYFLFKSFVKIELSYAFKINLLTTAENCTAK